MPLDTRIPLMAQPIQMPDFNALAMQKQEMQRNAMVMRQAQQQEQVQQAAMQRRQQIGSQAAGGDFAGAGKSALEAGDFDLHKTIQGLDDEQHQAAAKRNQTLAAVALSIADLPYEQRASAIRAAEPYLAQTGIDPSMIEQFDPTDENIAGIVSSTQQLDKLLEARAKANEPYTLGVDQARFVGGKEIARGPESIKAVTTPEGGTTTIFGGAGRTGMPGNTGGGIPFDALIGLESGGNHFAKGGGPLTSSKGAIGVAQVMPTTGPDAARAAGLPWDENRYRNDPQYNRALGEGYYNALRQKYGDDVKAAAAYNAGPGAVDKALAGGGDWLSRLPRETQVYVSRLPQNSMSRGGAPMVIRGAPKKPDETYQTLSAQDAAQMGLPHGPVYQRSTKTGEVKAISGTTSASTGAGTKQQQGLAKQKISGLRAIEGQLARVEAAMKEMESKGYSGPLLGNVPGSLDASSNTFDKAVAGLSPLIRALTRVPGEGQMSDYESRLAQMVVPGRTDTKEGRREALATMRELIRNTRSGYEEFLGEQPSGGGNVIRYDAKGNRVK